MFAPGLETGGGNMVRLFGYFTDIGISTSLQRICMRMIGFGLFVGDLR